MRSLVLAMVLLMACGGDDDGGGTPDAGAPANPGFVTPDVTTTAYVKNGSSWDMVGPANWSCLDTPGDDQASTVAIEVSGDVIARNTTSQLVVGAEISVYAGADLAGTPIDTAVVGDDGRYAVTLPVGTGRVAFKATAADYLDTYLMNQLYPPDGATAEADLSPVSVDLAGVLLALINQTRTAGTGVLAGAIRDCDDHEVGGAIATVSTTSGAPTHVDGSTTFYFNAGTDSSLPVNLNQQAYTAEDGLFMAIELPPADQVYFQVWGFLPGQDPATDELTLIAELAAPVFGESIVTASMQAKRTN